MEGYKRGDTLYTRRYCFIMSFRRRFRGAQSRGGGGWDETAERAATVYGCTPGVYGKKSKLVSQRRAHGSSRFQSLASRVPPAVSAADEDDLNMQEGKERRTDLQNTSTNLPCCYSKP